MTTATAKGKGKSHEPVSLLQRETVISFVSGGAAGAGQSSSLVVYRRFGNCMADPCPFYVFFLLFLDTPISGLGPVPSNDPMMYAMFSVEDGR